MADTPHADEKEAALRLRHALHPHPEAVRDPAFQTGTPFFDARDLVQVKYEMLRRVHDDGAAVNQAAAAFGFSRVTFYQAQAAFAAAGLPGLVPQRPGPRRAHKLSEAVVDHLAAWRAAEPSLTATLLAQRLAAEQGLRVHPRSIERALSRRQKKAGGPRQP